VNKDFARIVLIRLSSLGDVVRITGFPRAIRKSLPGAEITVVTHKDLAPLFEGAPGVDHVVLHRSTKRLLSAWRQARAALQPSPGGRRFDLAVDLQGTRASAAWTYASGASVKAGRGGLRPGWRICQPQDDHASDVSESAAIFERLGIPIGDPSPVLTIAPAADRRIEDLLRSEGLPARGFILINPFSRWETKAWPIERYAALIPRLRGDFARPLVITGGPGEAARAAGLVASMPPGTSVSLAGRLGLGDLAALLARARLVVTGDSGPMHMAAALATPVVALFGPTWPERAGPWGEGHRVVQRWRSERYRAYRDPASAIGMAAISLDDVQAAIAEALNEPPPVRS
jgi:heptosyltransferase I